MERSEFSVIDGDHSYLQRQGAAARRLTLPTAGGVERGAALIPVKFTGTIHTQKGSWAFRILCTFKQSHISKR
jgi:hypothetical protein